MCYYYKISRMAKITKTDNVGKDGEQGKFPYAAGGSILVQVLWKTVWYHLLKLMIHITCWLASLSWAHTNRNACPQAPRNTYKDDHSHLTHSAPMRSSKGPPTTQWISMHRWLGVYLHNSFLYSTEKWTTTTSDNIHKYHKHNAEQRRQTMNPYSMIPLILAQKVQAKPK